jgi:hypothetical protein
MLLPLSPKSPRIAEEQPLRDREIRAILRERLACTRRLDPTAVIIEEFGLRRRRVRFDLALVSSVLHGYEIKSDRDSLRRLAGQVAVYNDVFDRATLVVGERYAKHVFKNVPAWWEVLLASRGTTGTELHRLREGSRNPNRSARALAELLWAQDAMRLFEKRRGSRGYKSKPRAVLWDLVSEIYSLDEIASEVRNLLKARKEIGSAVRYS